MSVQATCDALVSIERTMSSTVQNLPLKAASIAGVTLRVCQNLSSTIFR